MGYPPNEAVVIGQFGQPLGRDLAEHPYRIALAFAPQISVHRGEEVGSFRMPGPAQVKREFLETNKGIGQHGPNGESSDCLHVDTT